MMLRRTLLPTCAVSCAVFMTLAGCSGPGFLFSFGVSMGTTVGTSPRRHSHRENTYWERSEAPPMTYRYYPDDEIYYNEDRGVYFWRNSLGEWTHGTTLPTKAMIGDVMAFERVTLHVEDPTVFHASFVRAFPASGVAPTHSQTQAIATVTSDDSPH